MTLTVKMEMNFEDFYEKYGYRIQYGKEFGKDIFNYLTEIGDYVDITESFIEEFIDIFIKYDEDELIERFGGDDLKNAIENLECMGFLYFVHDVDGKTIYLVEE